LEDIELRREKYMKDMRIHRLLIDDLAENINPAFSSV
jgi:hypothetical protein